METKIDVNNLDYSNIIVRVKLVGAKRYILRIRIGLFLVRLGVRIIGLDFQYDGIEP